MNWKTYSKLMKEKKKNKLAYCRDEKSVVNFTKKVWDANPTEAQFDKLTGSIVIHGATLFYWIKSQTKRG